MRLSDQFTRILRTVAVVLGGLVLATGCTVPGRPAPQYLDPGSLDVGAFSVHPMDEPAGGETYGRVVESTRMAEALIDPAEADPALTGALGSDGVRLLPTAAKATLLLAAPVRAVLEREGMLAGAATGGTEAAAAPEPAVGKARLLSLLILRFPDEGSAQRAARDIDAVDAALGPGNVAIPVPGYPAAHAHWRPTVPTAAATIADGAFVVSLYLGEITPDATALMVLAHKAFDAQLPRLREFTATPRDRLAALPVDRDDMLRRIVPEAPGHWPYPIVVVNTPQRDAGWDEVIRAEGVVYGPRAARLWDDRPQRDRQIELEAVNGLTSLSRYSSAAAARFDYNRAVRGYAAASSKRAVPGPAGVPDIYCAEDTSAGMQGLLRFGCRLLHERYQAILVGPDLTDMRQRAAAQYGLLVNGG
ncbi:MAG: hypothetical protein JWN03_3411 [Nocardia sp.]|uniref:DUF7373 family lipoprotein n=1 Tax=Nocardia sp. TaxID=1821 RepID=UPI002601C372|nr:hypothetical protein [Nocardia sp.]MCU1643136.1 hypothetical protein [Nocardia sp.]